MVSTLVIFMGRSPTRRYFAVSAPASRAPWTQPIAYGIVAGKIRRNVGAVMSAMVLFASVGAELTRYTVDCDAATLTPAETVILPANVQYAWPHRSGRALYVASSDSASGMGKAADCHHLTAFAVNGDTGALTPHGDAIRLPTRPIHITTDGPSDHVLVAFNNPAAIRVYRIKPDATLDREIEQPAPIDPGIFPHQIRITSDNHMAILVARGHDAAAGKPEQPGALQVFAYRDGVLLDQTTVAPGGGYGFGPRHLDFHPTRPWVYVSIERQNRLDMFVIDGANLSRTAQFSRDLLSRPPLPGVSQLAGAVHVHPNGRFVYAANRAPATAQAGAVFGGGENTIAVFEIDQRTGEPHPIQHLETHGIHCRTFHIDPSGRLLVAAHIMSMPVKDGDAIRIVPARLSVFRIATNGTLTFVRAYDVDVGSRTMFWMGMVPLRPS
jgi:6-phosphogluconolactonase